VNLSREVRLGGRNICRINGRGRQLADAGGGRRQLLVDVHGQGEHLGLLQPKTHIHLHRSLRRAAIAARKQVAERVRGIRAASAASCRSLRQDARTIAQRLDMLSFQVEEIAVAASDPRRG
jgi:DNA repair protein RecN (Recombination protein N)